jgi:hypothetical protein
MTLLMQTGCGSKADSPGDKVMKEMINSVSHSPPADVYKEQ